MNKLFKPGLLFFLLFFVLLSCPVFASYVKNIWPLWEVHDPLSTASIDHGDWQKFLDKHVITNQEGITLVDYAHIDNKELQALQAYIAKMGSIKIENYNRREQLAFWINLYNALTVLTVAHYYPVGSIDEINTSPGLFSIGPWATKLITINKTQLSLDDIQNRIIRPIWNDPRTLYAINNGSIGAPNLSKETYYGSLIESQLNEAAFNYVNSYRGAQITEGKCTLSKMYEWYMDDFGGAKKNVLLHIKQFAREPLKSQLNHINTIDNYVYNWHLNKTFVDSGG